MTTTLEANVAAIDRARTVQADRTPDIDQLIKKLAASVIGPDEMIAAVAPTHPHLAGRIDQLRRTVNRELPMPARLEASVFARNAVQQKRNQVLARRLAA